MAATSPAPGRPREVRVDDAVARAVRQLLAEHGYAGTTIGRIARQAGVGRGALYRRWRSKAELVFASVVHPVALGAPPDTGSLSGDLEAVVAIVQARVSEPTAAAALAGLAAELRADPSLAGALEERVFAEERRWVATILERAQARGELAGPADPELVRRCLVGPVALASLYSPAAPPVDAGALAGLLSRGLAR
jgi:AcrR family transcriptional regulator